MATVYQTPGVYIEELPSGSRPIQGVATAVAAFLGFTYTRPAGNTGQPVSVASWNQFVEDFCTVRTRKMKDGKPVLDDLGNEVFDVTVVPYVKGFYLPHAVYGYFDNGGTTCYVQSIAVVAEKDGAAQPAAKAAALGTSVPLLTQGDAKALELRSKARSGSPPIEIEIGDAGGDAPAPEQFKVTVRRPGQTEQSFDNLTMDRGKGQKNSAVEVLKQVEEFEVTEGAATGTALERRPKNGRYQIPAPAALQVAAAKPAVTAETFRGNATERTGLGALEEIADVTMLVCPDLMSMYEQSKRTADDRKAVALAQNAMLAHCAKMKDRFAILDPLPDMDRIDAVVNWRQNESQYNADDGKYGAFYYPWIGIANPLAKENGSKTMLVPPSGHIAGVYARTDSTRGVHKAPANEAVRGVVELGKKLIDSEQAKLNPIGVNCIRAFPGRGTLVWGARTLAEPSSEWRYVNVRRLFNYIEESIYEGTQWVVFEPNDMDLWERVKRTITAFLTNVWRDGALFGTTPEEAFYVKCDAELNPPAVRDAGQLIVEVGIAPVKPAEFVIFRFKQMSGGGEISE